MPPPRPSSFFTPAFIAEHDDTWPVWVSCPGCVPSHLLVHPQPPHWQGSMRSWKVLGSVALRKHCSATTENSGVLALLLPSKVQNTTSYELLQGKLTLSQPKTMTINYLPYLMQKICI